MSMADDHMHLAVAADGTLYVSLKVGHSSSELPLLDLLVRHPQPGGTGGTWDNIYPFSTSGTRPIVVLNEDTDTLRVYYTTESGGSMFVRESPRWPINFGPVATVLTGGVNDATSTKDRWAGRLVVLASIGGRLRRAHS